jgi:hypothetical protein
MTPEESTRIETLKSLDFWPWPCDDKTMARGRPIRESFLAMSWLRTVLAKGPLPVRQIEEVYDREGKATSFGWRTVERYKKDAGFASLMRANDWWWGTIEWVNQEKLAQRRERERAAHSRAAKRKARVEAKVEAPGAKINSSATQTESNPLQAAYDRVVLLVQSNDPKNLEACNQAVAEYTKLVNECPEEKRKRIIDAHKEHWGENYGNEVDRRILHELDPEFRTW